MIGFRKLLQPRGQIARSLRGIHLGSIVEKELMMLLGFRLPGGHRPVSHARQGRSVEYLAGIGPTGVNHSKRAVLATGGHEPIDVRKSRREVRSDIAPAPDSRLNDLLDVLSGERSDETGVIRLGLVVPRNGDNVFRQLRDQFGVFIEGFGPAVHIGPKHRPLAELGEYCRGFCQLIAEQF